MAINNLNKLIKDLESEIIQLKTAQIKSATQIGTTVKSTTITFTFRAATSTTPSVTNYLITATPTDDNPMLAMASVSPTNFDGRSVNIVRYAGAGTTIGFYLFAYGNQSDRDIISGGGTATATYQIDVTASSPFTLSVSEAVE